MKTLLRLLSASFTLLVATSLCAQSNYAASYTVTTFAGEAGYGSSDGTGSDARFNSPMGVAVDSSGNIFVADWNNQTIRKITAGGVVTTIAGLAGSVGSADGKGSAARFNFPRGIAVDNSGNLFVADTDNFTIRKITRDGVVTTLAGAARISGDADATGSAARFYSPRGVAVDGAGNVFVADTINQTIRKITAGGVVTTVAGSPRSNGHGDGTGSAVRFNSPWGIAVDSGGNVFVADGGNSTIRKITADGVVTTLAGLTESPGSADGVGSAARFASPVGVAVDDSGNVFVADGDNFTIRRITAAGVVTTLAGSAVNTGDADGIGSMARFSPFFVGVTADAYGNVFVADTNNHAIRKIGAGGVVTTVAGMTTNGSADGPGNSARFISPRGIAVDRNGNVFVADTSNQTIRKITTGRVVTTFAGTAGSVGSADGTGVAARFNFPGGVMVDDSGNVFVADTLNHTIRKITADGVVTTLAGLTGNLGSADGTGSAARFNRPSGVAVDVNGNIFVADFGNTTIRKITAGGVVTTLAGSAGNYGRVDGTGGAARFYSPRGVAVDSIGNVFVADTFNNTIRKITTGGIVTTIADGAGFFNPCGVAVGGNGNVFVADTLSRAIYRITAGGVVTLIAGSVGLSGSADGTGSAAQFNDPYGVAVDSSGNVFIADTSNNTIRRGVPSYAAGPTITTQPATVAVGGNVTLSVTASGTPTSTYQWQFNGTSLTGATSASLIVNNLQPENTGIYTTVIGIATDTATSDPAILGVLTTSKVIGTGAEIAQDIFVESNKNTFDQVLPSGAALAVTADPLQITRTSFVDLTDDIVQVEFSGAGTLSLVLNNPSGPAQAANYNQSTLYMKGHVGIVITGADETTNFSIFSVGKITAVNQALFKDTVTYDGLADVAFIAISTTNGKFGGFRASNASFYATKGVTGVYAPGVAFQGPVFVGDIGASDVATPVLIIGSSPDTRITGGDLFQANGQPVKVAGLTELKFTAGSDSHGNALSAKTNKAVLVQNGIDITAQIVANSSH